MAQNPTPDNARAAKIKYELAVRGLTCSELDRRHDLYRGQCANALYEPDEAGERVLANAIGQSPQDLWPERFDPTGERLIPQPRANYRTRGFRESCAKRKAA